MRFKKYIVFHRFFILLVITSLVILILPHKNFFASESEQSLGEISLVPLDDRPFNVYTPKMISKIGGFQVNTPDKELLGKYFTPGNSTLIGEWWMKDSDKTSSSVVAIPMLAYGGLINSRYGNVSLETARDNLQIIKDYKEQYPDKKLYAYDTLTRLTISPTRDYPGNYAGEIREWSILKDEIENLGMNDDERVQRYNELTALIPEELIEDYLKTRKRNFEINNLMIEWVKEGYIDFLIIGQDDAEPYGLHRPEHEALKERISELNLEDKIVIMPGADVVGSLLVTKLMLEELNVNPKVFVEYSRIHGDDWIAPYQNIPYSSLIQNYVNILGGKIVSKIEEADIVLMANTAGVEQIDSFAEKIYEYIGRGYHVTIGDDAIAGVSDQELISLLKERIKFSSLYGYSGWNIGVSITQSFARFGLMESVKQGQLNILERSAKSHLELLLESLAHEEAYRNHIRDDTRKLAETLGDDPQNILNNFDMVNNYAVTQTAPLANKWYENHFYDENIKLGGNSNIIGTVTSLSKWEMYLPWNRYQELAVFPELDLTLSPSHKHSLVRNTPLPYHSVASIGDEIQEVKVLVTNEHNQPIKGTISLGLPEGWSTHTSDLNSFLLEPNEGIEMSFIVNIPNDVTPNQTYELMSNLSYYLIRGNGYSPNITEKHSSKAFYITPQHINYALQSEGGIATASSSFNAYTPELAIDGNSTNIRSRWISEKEDVNWLQVSFPKERLINNVKFIGYNGYPINDYKIQVLQNDRWIEVASVTGNSEVIVEHTFNSIEAEAVRLWITKTRDKQARIYELEVYKK
ncbi:F5/8 type C domain-containing protein [Bacillus oleivorans]|uniref:F5/8 type C domain-containing protein n=1 Tax=Bacillus oleivorans TaxID=1448271 RepID=A0A285D6P4_9BACI|nr:DUF4127 family protein [Bacillus oleivorans]SNX75487.1 F5/8 type C domain-containing protein [Bacillus oleivorans]